MKVTVFCSSEDHPIYPRLQSWINRPRNQSIKLELKTEISDLVGGDLLFLVSCNHIIQTEITSKFSKVLVLHASNLPQGRGWSPYIWSILSGANEIWVTLLEAAYPVDTGPIWLKRNFQLNGYELLTEIHDKLFALEIDLMEEAMLNFKKILPSPQLGEITPPYPKRTPMDSRLDVNRTIAEQFNLLRVCDSNRFPSFFDYLGHRYYVRIERENEQK